MASSRNWHGGKGSVRRPGTDYEDNYDAIFGNKETVKEPKPESDPALERFLMHMVGAMIVIYVLAISILAII